jgi:hypothetical protein
MSVDVLARDVTGQKNFKVSADREATVGEMIKGLLVRMNLVSTDEGGRPLEYRARLEREGRQLHGSELVRDALETDDELVLTPQINAG